MSLWEHACFVEGWNESQGGDDEPEGMSVERLRELAPAPTMH